MKFRPRLTDTLLIDGITYCFVPYPGDQQLKVPYQQDGRQAQVYGLVPCNTQSFDRPVETVPLYALKVFKVRYRLEEQVRIGNDLSLFADLPGLEVCKRRVLTSRFHADLLEKNPDLAYAVFMPWIVGPSWVELVVKKEYLTTLQSHFLAWSLINVLAKMESQSVAHCDLSGPNVLLPCLVASASTKRTSNISLVDIEQLYGPGLTEPKQRLGGSPGYTHQSAPNGEWSTVADRFAGAILVGEMLGWCDEHVRGAAYGEQYFDPGEMQRSCERYDGLVRCLTQRWGREVSTLFEKAWESNDLSNCPSFVDWLQALPEPDMNSNIVDARFTIDGFSQPLPQFVESAPIKPPKQPQMEVIREASARPEIPKWVPLFDSIREEGKVVRNPEQSASQRRNIDSVPNNPVPTSFVQDMPRGTLGPDVHRVSREVLISTLLAVFVVVGVLVYITVKLFEQLPDNPSTATPSPPLSESVIRSLIVSWYVAISALISLTIGTVERFVFRKAAYVLNVPAFIGITGLAGGIGGLIAGLMLVEKIRNGSRILFDVIVAGIIIGAVAGGLASFAQSFLMRIGKSVIRWVLSNILAWSIVWGIGWQLIDWRNNFAAGFALIVIATGAAISIILAVFRDIEF